MSFNGFILLRMSPFFISLLRDPWKGCDLAMKAGHFRRLTSTETNRRTQYSK